MTFKYLLLTLLATTNAFCLHQIDAQAADLTSNQKLLREIYQELVEINTTASTGDCTKAATAMAARLQSGGYADSEIQIIVPPGGPTKGNLVARLKGSGEKKPILLHAHIDVVEAKREDWQRDPFKLIEENGVFYARGSSDDKAMGASFVTNMIRYKREHLSAKRDLILALTCDEETIPSQFDGVDYLLRNHRNLVDAELALSEVGGGFLDKNEKPVRNTIQIGEKVFQSYQLEVTNPGGHSARPLRDNAIYHLADGLSRLGKFDFPFKLTEATRVYYERMSAIESGQVAADMKAILRDPPDPDALARLYAVNPDNNAMVRTTCVATMVDAGHATNALPQRARAVVNCRVLPGESVADVQKNLVRVLADDKITITPMGTAVLSPAPPLTPAVMRAVEDISTEMWPGVPLIPAMQAGASDGRFLNNAGIWTYGVSGMFAGAEGSGVHGLNEHIRVNSLFDGFEFLYRLAKRLGQE